MAGFKPRFHYCKDGNHYHLVTGPDFGASPAFGSIKGGEFLIGQAVEPGNQDDLMLADALRLQLRHLRYRAGSRSGRLPRKSRPWETPSITGWHKFLAGDLQAGDMEQFIFFMETPCDFIEKCRVSFECGSETCIGLRPRKVSEVLC